MNRRVGENGRYFYIFTYFFMKNFHFVYTEMEIGGIDDRDPLN